MFRSLRISLHDRALAIESLLNRLISLSFARQLHQRCFPGDQSDKLSERIMSISVEARRDTVQAIREAAAFVREADVHDHASMRSFAVRRGLRIGGADAERRRVTEELWQHLTLRGASLMARRGVFTPGDTYAGFGVAAGS